VAAAIFRVVEMLMQAFMEARDIQVGVGVSAMVRDNSSRQVVILSNINLQAIESEALALWEVLCEVKLPADDGSTSCLKVTTKLWWMLFMPTKVAFLNLGLLFPLLSCY
jgi:hypothetical protein